MSTKRICLLLTVINLLSLPLIAETWHLNPESGWQNLDNSPQGQYLKKIADYKRNISTSEDASSVEMISRLKEEFPEYAGKDMDEFIKAETLYFNQKWGKAAKFFQQFTKKHPDSPLYSVAMERLFSIGTAFLQGQKKSLLVKWIKLPAFDDGVKIMQNIADMTGNSPMALRALEVTAENQEKKKKYLDAYQTWSQIADRWPTADSGKNALFRMAQAMYASYRSPKYDISPAQSAKVYYKEYESRYPDSAKELDVPETLSTIEEQLAYKKYHTGMYYEKTENTAAAAMYYQLVLDKWPESKAAEMARIRMSDDATDVVHKTTGKKLFDIGNKVCDTWFGVTKLVQKKNQ